MEIESLKQQILQRLIALPEGGRIKRRALAVIHGTSEREVTEAISQLVNIDCYPILNHGAGYFYSKDPEAIRIASRLLRSQAVKMILRANRLDKHAVGVHQISLGA